MAVQANCYGKIHKYLYLKVFENNNNTIIFTSIDKSLVTAHLVANLSSIYHLIYLVVV